MLGLGKRLSCIVLLAGGLTAGAPSIQDGTAFWFDGKPDSVWVSRNGVHVATFRGFHAGLPVVVEPGRAPLEIVRGLKNFRRDQPAYHYDKNRDILVVGWGDWLTKVRKSTTWTYRTVAFYGDRRDTISVRVR